MTRFTTRQFFHHLLRYLETSFATLLMVLHSVVRDVSRRRCRNDYLLCEKFFQAFSSVDTFILLLPQLNRRPFGHIGSRFYTYSFKWNRISISMRLYNHALPQVYLQQIGYNRIKMCLINCLFRNYEFSLRLDSRAQL